MAKAKIVKRKRKLRLDRFATLLFTLSAILYLGAKFALKTYNYELSMKAAEKQQEVTKMKETVSTLETEVNELQSRDRVLSVAEEDGISTNQDNVIVMGNDNSDEE